MTKTNIFLMALGLCLFSIYAWADEDRMADASPSVLATHVEAGGILTSTSGDKAKFNEYRDIDDELYGNAEFKAYEEDMYFEFGAQNIGRDDQSYDLKAGRLGSFTFNAFYDEIPHNFAYGAKSYLNGVGTANLTDSGNIADPDAWASFDYTKERKNMGFEGEFAFKTPYYVAFGGSLQQSDGIYPLGGPSGRELPSPIDWEENRWFAEGGYRGKTTIADFRFQKSDFKNTFNAMTWDGNTTSLPPDSEYFKVSGNFISRYAFLDSTLAIRLRHSQKENNTSLFLMDPSTNGSYHGEVKTTGLDISYDFVPAETYDIKLYGKLKDTDDDSDVITVNGLTTQPYDHEKATIGVNGTWQPDSAHIVDAGCGYSDAERTSRTDNDETTDYTLFLQYRNRSYEKVNFRGKLAFLDRTGDFDRNAAYEWEDVLDAYVATPFADDGSRRYDVADQIRYRLELAMDIFFFEAFDAGVEYAWWDSDYKDTDFGLTGTTHHQIYVSGNYAAFDEWLASFYFGYEYDRNKLVTDRSWSQKETFDTFSYGVFVELPTIKDMLAITVSWDHAIVDGDAEFKPASGGYADLTSVDDLITQRLEIKGLCRITDGCTLKLGYIFEDFDLDDGQYHGYTYLPAGATLTGAYADQDARSHTTYAGVAFDF